MDTKDLRSFMRVYEEKSVNKAAKQLFITLFNLRTDEYGGSLENRLRFAREVVEEVKARCGKDFPVALRFSVKSMIKDWREGALPGEEFEEKGRDVEEGLEAAKLLVA